MYAGNGIQGSRLKSMAEGLHLLLLAHCDCSGRPEAMNRYRRMTALSLHPHVDINAHYRFLG
jgi:hypothetical protein